MANYICTYFYQENTKEASEYPQMRNISINKKMKCIGKLFIHYLQQVK